jgi:predicted adenine nucleotide alpha hydrolase (AANH) superfamily ATPase
MADTLEIIRQANQEREDNRDKAVHNFDCNFSELQPYDNAAFLEMIRHMNWLVANAEKCQRI